MDEGSQVVTVVAVVRRAGAYGA
ncbi:MAG TPA: hypothetical protein VHD58_04380 [Mycobacteriales bacterium]|nr:hypothetical protein [Mycobacteriales bacterium]